MTDGVVFHIQRFSVHDGPGIRTTVFLKGCTLRCAWCHNPEGIAAAPELRYLREQCIHCGSCVPVCPVGAHTLAEGRHQWRRDLCTACGACVQVCPSGALIMAGRRMGADEVVAEVLVDRVFYESGPDGRRGGLTLSGGEPLHQHVVAREILSLTHEAGVHTAVQTAANLPWSSLESVLPVTDLVMLDIKHLDPERHREGTGADNRLILANAERLAAADVDLAVRIPVVPGFNDDLVEIARIRRFVESLRRLRPAGASLTLELLPFHPLAADKYDSMQTANPVARLTPPTPQRMRELRAAARLLEQQETAWKPRQPTSR